jgi:S-layer protein (TIGR01567 family)
VKLLHLALILAFFPHPANAVIDLEIRGPVAYATSGSTYTWTSQDCPLFFYEMDENLGNESIELTVSDGNQIRPNDIIYSTKSYINQFKYNNWGSFEAIGFQGKEYLAAYLYDNDDSQLRLARSSKEAIDMFQDNLISRILINDDSDYSGKSISDSEPLQLKEGYLLSIEGGSSENKQIRIVLSKNGNQVDNAYIKDDTTYRYTKKLGDFENVILIAIHFEKIFVGDNIRDDKFADIDGIWQISDDLIKLNDIKFNYNMEDIDLQEKSITISNGENIVLTSGKRIKLLWNIDELSLDKEIGIRVAKQKNIYYENPLRFYVYKKIYEPGTYQIRSPVQELLPGNMSIDADSFAGFYYDLNEGIHTEKIKLNISDEKELQKNGGIIYTTSSQKENFSYNEWGYFNVVGFMGRKFFASYNMDNNSILGESSNENLLGDRQQLSEVLMDYEDSDFDQSLDLRENDKLNLSEEYSLKVKSIDINGNKVYLELFKGNDSKESKVIVPSMEDPRNSTFVYKANLGKAKNITLIAVHFDAAFRGSEEAVTTVDGIWQISERAIDVGDNQKFDIMKVTSVDKIEGKITLINSKRILLKGNQKIMNSIWIMTSDDQKRFCIYRDAVLPQHRAIIIPRELKN